MSFHATVNMDQMYYTRSLAAWLASFVREIRVLNVPRYFIKAYNSNLHRNLLIYFI